MFPAGMSAPKRVRIYGRSGHYLLQFWDPSLRRTLCDRVDGDLLDALAKARQIDVRLDERRRSGHVPRRTGHGELVEAFRRDLGSRSDAGAIAPATAARYASALGHYLRFVSRPKVAAAYPKVFRVDRSFAMEFSAYLGTLTVCGNGRPNGRRRRPMLGQAFVLDAARAMFEWAADPERGQLLPSDFRNPFRRRVLDRRRAPAADPTAAPDVSLSMTADFLRACDGYQLRLFTPLVFYGLRPGELVYLFREMLGSDGDSDGFLNVACIEELGYLTKGRRNKRLPLLGPIATLLKRDDANVGLLFHRRGVQGRDGRASLLGLGLPQVVEHFRARCDDEGVGANAEGGTAEAGHGRARRVVRCREMVLREAGGLTYKLIQGEFSTLARRLGWPAAATLKDFRHGCNTALANGGMPEHERRYLLGQHPGRAAIVTYTHLNKLGEHYRDAVDREMSPLLDILRQRITDER
jgi:integrase